MRWERDAARWSAGKPAPAPGAAGRRRGCVAGLATPLTGAWLAADPSTMWGLVGAGFGVLCAVWYHARARRALRRADVLEGELGQERQKHAELRDSEVALRTGLAGAGQVVLLVDVAGNVRYASPNLGACLGVAVEAVRGKSIATLFGNEPLERLGQDHAIDNLRLAVPSAGALRVVRIDVRPAPVLGTAWLFTCRDVSQEVEAERKAETQRRDADEARHVASLGTLVSSLAHEINNPNHTIMLNVQVLRGAWLDVIPVLDEHARQHGDFRVANIPYRDMRDDVSNMVDAVYQSADRIRSIIGGLRDYARDYGRRQMTAVDLAGLLHGAAQATVVHAPELRGRLRVDVPANLPPLRGSPLLLEQALLEVLLLAAGAEIAPGQAREVDVTARAGARAEVLIEVCGPGQPTASVEQARLAQPFHGSPSEPGYKNWHLALVAWIVQQHQGTLAVEARGEHGAVWRLVLPTTMVP